MARTVILMPFRGGTLWRDRHFSLVYDHLEQMGLPIYVADSGSEPFSVSSSWNLAADEAGDWDIAVLNEADLYVPISSIWRAIDRVESGLVYAWDRLTGLTEAATEAFYHGQREFVRTDIKRTLPTRNGYIAKGGPRVVTRDLWEKVRGFDYRFKGWGGEDDAFAHTCHVLGGPAYREEGHLIELWHPRRKESDEAFFKRVAINRSLWREIQAIRDPAKMRAYVEMREINK